MERQTDLLAAETESPKEQYRFSFAPEEVEPLHRIVLSGLRKRMFFMCLFMVWPKIRFLR